MVFENHIAYRFLTDDKLILEMCQTMYPEEFDSTIKKMKTVTREEAEKVDIDESVALFMDLTNNINQKAYYITESVIKNLDLLKVYKSGDHYNWKVFACLKPQKITLILPDNKLLRIRKLTDALELFWATFDKAPKYGENIDGKMKWTLFLTDTSTGYLSSNFDDKNVTDIEEFVYKLLCFFYLTENAEEILQPKSVTGTKKTGKIKNDFNFPIVKVTSKWNITTIRTEGFGVSGHFRLQPYKNEHKLIFIEPFIKNGYKRGAGKSNHIQ